MNKKPSITKFDRNSKMDKKYQPIIGMETHVELKTKSGMFCGCKNDPDAKKPNIHTCPVCLGLPGALPVANKKAIEWTIKLGLALGCKINKLSKFDRKHYFYPDLPKGYQISQYDMPFCYQGKVETSFGPVRITRVHLEEDTGKLIHQNINGHNVSLIDFNRSGVPLVEVVTEPDIFSSVQAKEYAKKLRQIIRYLDISDCDMEKGGMRLEANISLLNVKSQMTNNKSNSKFKLPNYKVELKNINSFRFLERGIEYEIERQREILESGKTPIQETRGYNAEKNITFTQRTKEEAADYRYFPDPDLPPINISEKWLNEIKSTLPEPFDGLFKRWQEKYNLKPELVELLFETAEESKKLEELFKKCIKEKLSVEKFVNAMVHKKIKTIEEFKKMTNIDEVSDDDLKVIIEKILKVNPKAVADYKAGKINTINFLVGMVMREAKKKIEFQRLQDLIKSFL
ncbi:MAG: Aspartyl/glutamyl-tRNA(Asn/Gln) amidotransferase subunit B [Candidatus Roizmanbacteria bacterium GW2011_GWC2_37_13]|uniref:Aspartyl/glutamyl-tRNA(Asn/Gln) amidotransferase subunit B n=1 Tax=Candidatus Roizmanbacteria bacterium GW2011_GWC2_37_13 TaxID=1618486 RepID=A0A0G0G5J6_9BACT|nr:MAG: Aspartyl/glutamyl-tRNA(Asn/Gln) amidotransferase subunit B [Candidatus Roizmanbacteria bacterium GW2011_GWC1_37_12]KKQ25307.1 MAG: Aspartyl/glutamyl-tRNA(Asn/Gln) amidotransferase subunit B [Candidatus Roizmanbacteria bacterium GW2011_GWC2_37_13]